MSVQKRLMGAGMKSDGKECRYALVRQDCG